MRAPIAARRSEGTTARAVHKKYWESTGCQHSARAGSLQALNALPRVTRSLGGVASRRRAASIGVYQNGTRAQQQTHKQQDSNSTFCHCGISSWAQACLAIAEHAPVFRLRTGRVC